MTTTCPLTACKVGPALPEAPRPLQENKANARGRAARLLHFTAGKSTVQCWCRRPCVDTVTAEATASQPTLGTAGGSSSTRRITAARFNDCFSPTEWLNRKRTTGRLCPRPRPFQAWETSQRWELRQHWLRPLCEACLHARLRLRFQTGPGPEAPAPTHKSTQVRGQAEVRVGGVDWRDGPVKNTTASSAYERI